MEFKDVKEITICNKETKELVALIFQENGKLKQIIASEYEVTVK